MNILKRLLCLLFCALFTLLPLTSCTKEEEPDFEFVDPQSLARATTLTALVTLGEEGALTVSAEIKDSFDLALSDVEITLSVGEESYTVKTDEKGVAAFAPALAAGRYPAVFSYAGNAYYRAASLTTEIVVHPQELRGGVYVRGRDLDAVDLDQLQRNRVGNLYLHEEIFDRVSNLTIEEFIAEAAQYNVQVHLWMVCLNEGGEFVVPIITEEGPDRGAYHQTHFDLLAERAKKAAALKGLAGIHLDFIRFDGETTRADKFRAKAGGGGEHAVTEMVRQMTEAAKSVNKELVFSGAVMPVNADLIPKYGQDLTALSKYIDFFIPMLYAGNYGEDTEWVRECMRLFEQNFPELDIRPALLTYLSDANQRKKEPADLQGEVQAVFGAGAEGVTLFHYEAGKTTLVDVEERGA